MTTVIKANGDGSSLFNALALGLSVEIISGRLDPLQDSPGYQALLDAFERHHPQFKPKTWDNLKNWLIYYNSPRDLELILAPVLLKLNQHYHSDLEQETLNELTDLVFSYKGNVDHNDQWYQLEGVGNVCPKLDNLDLEVRKKLLVDLNKLLKGQELERNPEAIREFLQKNAQGLLGELGQKIKADKNLFQRGYSIRSLRVLADSLSLQLMEGRVEPPSGKNARILLENKDQYWNIKFDDNDASQFLDRTPQRLKMTPMEAYLGDAPILAPSEEQSQEAAQSTFFMQRRILDNPGLGNCGFYAFATALLNIILEEKSYNNRSMFNRWVSLDPSISGLYERLPYLYEKILKRDIDEDDKELLDQLQSSLRIITFQYQVAELQKTSGVFRSNPKALEQNSNFVHFAALYYGDPMDTDSRFNPFANSRAILSELAKIDRSKVKENHENEVLMPIFLKLLYGDKINPDEITQQTEPRQDSPILIAMNNITQDFFWGTHDDLNYLAIAFKTNLHVLRTERAVQNYPNDIPDQHTITLQNLNNAHWTTEVMVPRKLKALSKSPSNKKDTDLKHSPVASKQSLVASNQPLASSHAIPLSSNTDSSDNSQTTSTATTESLDTSDLIEEVYEELTPDQKKLEYLKQLVAKATVEYVSYNSSIWFCFFHYHGATGRNRADNFNKEFAKITDFELAKESLLSYLGNESNGNTYAHSYRTMLLHGLQGNIRNKQDLNYISDNYVGYLQELRRELKPESSAYSP